MSRQLERITSRQNPRVKLINRLRDKRGREQEGLFVIDYERDLVRAIQQRYELEFAFISPDLADNAVIDNLDTSLIYEVSSDVMQKVSYRENPGGLVAVMRSKASQSIEELEKRDDVNHILGLVNLLKPGNIGALLRTADASGFDSIILIDTSLDLYNPNIIRSSTGTCFLNKIYIDNSDKAIDYLKSTGFNIISAHLDGNINLYDVDFRHKTAIIFGTEDKGLNQQWVENCDQLVKIPMVGSVADSLNVSVSGAVFMYEALRQTRHI